MVLYALLLTLIGFLLVQLLRFSDINKMAEEL